jgi:glycosyltransferase involved in cell wall biosynthesis
VKPVVCIVPTFNAASRVGDVVAGLRRSTRGCVIIGVDDGSEDDSATTLRRSCDDVITFAVNRGKGAALQAGMDRALEHGAGTVLTIDADGQHDPAAAPSLIAALGACDLVIGARARDRRMPAGRRLTNRLADLAIRIRTGRSVLDSQSGLRAMSDVVCRTVRARGTRYEFESDFLIRAAGAGFRIGAVPVATRYGPPSHFRSIRDGARVVRTLCLGL